MNFDSFCGYRDALTIKEIKKESINEIQEFVRNDLVATIQKLQNCENPVMIDETDFFGNININEPSKFAFSLGEKVQLEQIALFSKEIVINAKAGQFFFNKNNKVDNAGTVVYQNFGRYFSSKHSPTSGEFDSEAKMSELKCSLYLKVLSLFESFTIDRTILQQYTEDMVSVSIRNGKPFGSTKCIICIVSGAESKKKDFVIGSKLSKGKDNCYWITSNFSDHITGFHRIEKKSDASYTEKRVVTGITKICKVQPMTDNDKKKPVDSENMKKELCTQSLKEEKSCEMLTINEPEGTNLESIIFKQISIHLINLTTSKSNEATESMTFYCEDEEHVLQAVDVPEDGDCMFSAIAHQLNGVKVTQNDKLMLACDLRAKVTVHLADNIPTYKNDLLVIVYKNVQKVGKIKDEDIDDECKKAVEILKKTGEWGGNETLRAVISLYQVNILIVTEYGECYFIDGFDISLTKTIIIAYKLKRNIQKTRYLSNIYRNHYQSVVSMEHETILSIAKVISTKMETKFNSITPTNEIIVLS